MATATGFLAGSSTGHASEGRIPYLVESVVDFALRNAAAADVYQMISIPAETVVLSAGLEVLTTISSAGSVTFDLGAADDDQYVAAHATLTAGYATAIVAHTLDPRAFVTSADTLDLLVNTSTATAGKIRVWALMIDISGVNETMTPADASTVL